MTRSVPYRYGPAGEPSHREATIMRQAYTLGHVNVRDMGPVAKVLLRRLVERGIMRDAADTHGSGVYVLTRAGTHVLRDYEQDTAERSRQMMTIDQTVARAVPQPT